MRRGKGESGKGRTKVMEKRKGYMEEDEGDKKSCCNRRGFRNKVATREGKICIPDLWKKIINRVTNLCPTSHILSTDV